MGCFVSKKHVVDSGKEDVKNNDIVVEEGVKTLLPKAESIDRYTIEDLRRYKDEYIPPVADINDILQRIYNVLKTGVRLEREEIQADFSSFSDRRFLDIPENRERVNQILTSDGYTIVNDWEYREHYSKEWRMTVGFADIYTE